MSDVGKVGYSVELNLNDAGLGDAIKRSTRAVERFERTFQTGVGKLDTVFNRLEKSMSGFTNSIKVTTDELRKASQTNQEMVTASKAIATATAQATTAKQDEAKATIKAEQAAKASLRTQLDVEKRTGNAARQVEKLSTAYANMGVDAEKYIRPLSRALQEYSSQVIKAQGDSTVLTLAQEDFKQSIHDVQVEVMRYNKEQKELSNEKKEYLKVQKEAEAQTRAVAKAEEDAYKIVLQLEKSLGAAGRQVATLTSKLQGMEDGEQYVTVLQQAMEKYRADLQGAAGDTLATSRAQEEFKNSINGVNNSLEKAKVEKANAQMKSLEQQLQNTTKAVQLALGPLSGIAARITAFTSLLRTNTLGVASFVATLVGLVTVTGQAVKAAMEFERQMYGMQAVLESTGREAEITLERLNGIAEGVAEATLSSTNKTRTAATTLLTYSNIAVEAFEGVLVAAQGLSSMFGTDLTSATRQVARALEDPAANLDSLRRVGIQFNQVEKDKIRTMQAVGRIGEAQAIIFEKFAAAQNLALNEAKGLAGQLDTMGERLTRLREKAGLAAGTNEALGASIGKVNEVLLMFINDSSNFDVIIKAIEVSVSGLAWVIEFLASNVETVIALISGLFTASLVRGVQTLAAMTLGFVKLKGGVVAATKVLLGITAASNAAAAAMTRGAAAAALATTAWNALPMLAAAGVLIAMVRSFRSVAEETISYSDALRNLQPTSERSLSIQEKMAEAYAKTGKEAAELRRIAAEQTQETLFDALNTGAAELDQRIRALSLMRMEEFLDEQRWGVNAQGIEDISDKLSNLKAAMDEINKLRSTKQTLNTTDIARLTDALAELGEGDEGVEEFVQRLKDFVATSPSAVNAAGNLANGIESMRNALMGSFDASAFVSGLESGVLGELMTDMSNTNDMAIVLSSTLKDGSEQFDRVAKTISERYVSALRQANEALADGVINEEDYIRLATAIANEQAQLTRDIINAPALYKKAGQAVIDDFLKPYQREIKLANARSREGQAAVDALMREFERTDAIDSAVNALTNGANSVTKMNEVAHNLRATLQNNGTVIEGLDEYFDDFSGTLIVTEGSLNGTEDSFKAFVKAVITGLMSMAELDENTEKYADTLRSLRNTFLQAEVAAKGGLEAFAQLADMQDQQQAITELENSIKELDESALRNLAASVGITADSLEELRIKVIEASTANLLATRSAANQISSYQSLKNSIEELSQSYENSQRAARALATGGIKALDSELRKQEVAKTVAGMREEWDKLTNTVDRNRLIAALQTQFKNVTITAENFVEMLGELSEGVINSDNAIDSMRGGLESLNTALDESINRQSELVRQYQLMQSGIGATEALAQAADVTKARELLKEFEALADSDAVARHLEEWNAAFPDLFKHIDNFEADYVAAMSRARMQEEHNAKWAAAMQDLEKMFADTWDQIFSHGENGFKRSLQNMRKQFSQMLRNMAYEATIKPIMVEVSGAITGFFSGSNLGEDAQMGAGGSVGLSQILSISNMASTISKLGGAVENAGTALFKGLQNFAGGDIAGGMFGSGVKVGQVFGKNLTAGTATMVGAATNIIGGYAGKLLGNELGEALFGKQAASSWGSVIGGIAGGILGAGNPIATMLGSVLGSALDVAFGGDGKKRAFLGVDTNAGFDANMRGGTGYQKIADSGLKLTAMVNRAGEGAEEVANALVDAFAATDTALLGMYESLTGFVANLTGVYLVGKMVQAGTPDAGAVPSFFGSAEFDKLIQEDITGAADNFVRAWVAKVNEISGNALDFEPLFSLANEGELLADSLIRLTNQFEGANLWLGRLGQTLHGMSIDTVVAADSLIKLMGGLENFTRSTEAYFNNFFTEQEKLAQITIEVTKAFEGLGESVPETRDEFRRMVEALDLTTESGQGMFAAFMGLAPALDMILPAFEQLEDVMEGLVDKSAELSMKLLQMTNESAHITAVRDQELSQLDDYSKALQIHIWTLEDLRAAHEAAARATDTAIETVRAVAREQIASLERTYDATDSILELVRRSVNAAVEAIKADISALEATFTETDAAYAALERSVKNQIDTLSEQEKAAEEVEKAMIGLFDTLDKSIRDLRNSVEQTSRQSIDSARNIIREAISSGDVSNTSAITDAIATVQGGLRGQSFATSFERDAATLMLAKQLEDLKNISEPQLSEAEQQVKLARDQIELLEQQLIDSKAQIDALRGVDTSISFVNEAVSRLQTAISAEEQARVQIETLNSQIDLLQLQLTNAEEMVDILRGVDLSITTVDEAIRLLQTAVEAEEQARAQIEIIQEQLALAEAQYEELRGINAGVKTVEQAINGLAAAIAAERAAAGAAGSMPSFKYNDQLTNEEILAYVQDVDRTSSSAAEVVQRVYDAAKSANVGSAQLASAIGMSQQEILRLAAEAGLPAFARGGVHSGGLRLVGENGPEIEATGASRIFSARQVANDMFDTTDIVDAILELKEELQHIKAGNVQIARNTKGSLDLERRWEAIGQPPVREGTQ